MNIDVTSAVADVGVLPGQVDAEPSADLPAVDGTELCDFHALVQQLNAVITDIAPPDTTVITDVVVDSLTDGVTQPDDAPVSETRDRYSDEQSSLTSYLSGAEGSLLFSDSDQFTGPDVLPPPVSAPVALDQWQPDINMFARELPVVVQTVVPGSAAVQSSTTVPLDRTPSTTPSAEIMSVDGRALCRSVGSATRQPELQKLSAGTESVEPPTISTLTASANGSSFADVRPGSVPSLSDSPAPPKATPPPLSLPEMLIAGGQHHARAVAHLPSLGTVQVEMTRASASEVAVHVYAQELTVAALERSSPAIHHLVASTVQPTLATEATIREAGYASGSEPGIKIAMSLTSQNQSQADSREFQPQGRVESSRSQVVLLTPPGRVAPVTSLVDLLI